MSLCVLLSCARPKKKKQRLLKKKKALLLCYLQQEPMKKMFLFLKQEKTLWSFSGMKNIFVLERIQLSTTDRNEVVVSSVNSCQKKNQFNWNKISLSSVPSFHLDLISYILLIFQNLYVLVYKNNCCTSYDISLKASI